MKRLPPIKDAAKRYAASQLLQVSEGLLLTAWDLTNRATAWNAKGLSDNELHVIRDTAELINRARIRHQKVNRRLMSTLETKYGWGDDSE